MMNAWELSMFCEYKTAFSLYMLVLLTTLSLEPTTLRGALQVLSKYLIIARKNIIWFLDYTIIYNEALESTKLW
jgi:hypothetical protein